MSQQTDTSFFDDGFTDIAGKKIPAIPPARHKQKTKKKKTNQTSQHFLLDMHKNGNFVTHGTRALAKVPFKKYTKTPE